MRMLLLLPVLIVATTCGGDGVSSGADPDRCSREDWPGPWTACPDAEWTRDAAAAAGYRVVGETGSALVVSDGIHTAYLWATRNGRTASREWRRQQPLAVLGATPVYGDRDLWRFWRAGPFAVWLKQGPSADSRIPQPSRLGPLVEATVRFAPPG